MPREEGSIEGRDSGASQRLPGSVRFAAYEVAEKDGNRARDEPDADAHGGRDEIVLDRILEKKSDPDEKPEPAEPSKEAHANELFEIEGLARGRRRGVRVSGSGPRCIGCRLGHGSCRRCRPTEAKGDTWCRCTRVGGYFARDDRRARDWRDRRARDRPGRASGRRFCDGAALFGTPSGKLADPPVGSLASLFQPFDLPLRARRAFCADRRAEKASRPAAR